MENNFPIWTMYVIAISQIVFAVAIGAIAAVLIGLLGTIKQVLTDVNKMTGELNNKLPGLLNNVDATMGNVKTISDEAKVTAHNVTGTVNRVAQVTSSVASRLESPLIKGVGTLTGVAAGVRALRGGGKKEVVVHEVPKRKGGLLGFFKK